MRLVPGARPLLALAVLASSVIALAWVAPALRAGAALDDDWPHEADRLARDLGLRPGMTVAEIGAGHGELTVQMARRVGPDGRVFSTEIDAARQDDIRRAVAEASLDNVTVVAAGERDTNLPDGCCDAIYMREVFHHFGDRSAMTASLRRALKPGGRMAVIDYPLRNSFGGDCHCIDKAEMIRMVTAQGFEVVREEDKWAGIRYLVVFRRGPA